MMMIRVQENETQNDMLILRSVDRTTQFICCLPKCFWIGAKLAAGVTSYLFRLVVVSQLSFPL